MKVQKTPLGEFFGVHKPKKTLSALVNYSITYHLFYDDFKNKLLR